MTRATDRKPTEEQLRLLSEVANGKVRLIYVFSNSGAGSEQLFIREVRATGGDRHRLNGLRDRRWVQSVYAPAGCAYVISDEGRAALRRYWPDWKPEVPE